MPIQYSDRLSVWESLVNDMAKKTQKQRGGRAAGRHSLSADDNLDDDMDFDPILEDQWLTESFKGKQRSRILRQMRARRELERRQDEKRLRALVDDWCFEECT